MFSVTSTDPVPEEYGHYRSFDEALGYVTDESHRPSMHTKAKRRKTLPFSASLQHVKNVDLMLQCEECSMWRLLYSKHKLNHIERTDLLMMFHFRVQDLQNGSIILPNTLLFASIVERALTLCQSTHIHLFFEAFDT